MKKLFTLISVVAVAGAVSTASAIDRTGNFGLGYQQSFTGGNIDTSLGAISFKYGASSAANIQLALGFDTGSMVDDAFNIGLGFTYDIVENENSDFFTGFKFGALRNKTNAQNYMLRFQVPLGMEWSFSGLPEVGFSASAGFIWDYGTTGKNSSIGTFGGGFDWGVHYYF